MRAQIGAEVGIREKNVQGGGGAGPRGVQDHSFYGSSKLLSFSVFVFAQAYN
jgi:hypothetical protein